MKSKMAPLAPPQLTITDLSIDKKPRVESEVKLKLLGKEISKKYVSSFIGFLNARLSPSDVGIKLDFSGTSFCSEAFEALAAAVLQADSTCTIFVSNAGKTDLYRLTEILPKIKHPFYLNIMDDPGSTPFFPNHIVDIMKHAQGASSLFTLDFGLSLEHKPRSCYGVTTAIIETVVAALNTTLSPIDIKISDSDPDNRDFLRSRTKGNYIVAAARYPSPGWDDDLAPELSALLTTKDSLFNATRYLRSQLEKELENVFNTIIPSEIFQTIIPYLFTDFTERKENLVIKNAVALRELGLCKDNKCSPEDLVQIHEWSVKWSDKLKECPPSASLSR